ncbi:MAG: crossover junction endodeoxyribonuclease RuvC [Bacteroidales bacterium]|jgi:crossover junction endodeoxyribonuclease RuvC|nr:crossover junction endodeoxyribonuclease RuvC [Bacteroidales bacterium]MDN5328479.1 crossover junction endodeoxyribonuclease RuvC [Bacteroidales bacterium]
MQIVEEKIILGIDPGTTVMGYGIIRCLNGNPSLVTLGVLKLSGYSEQALKLKRIFERTLSLIDEFHPHEVAIEAPFYGKNVQSMLKLGRAQGVAMAAAMYRSVPICEYSPRKIKQSITGNGNASKEQVAAMLMRLMSIPQTPETFDATDGLAVAVCHYFQQSPVQSEKNYSSWKAFLNDNPDRLK